VLIIVTVSHGYSVMWYIFVDLCHYCVGDWVLIVATVSRGIDLLIYIIV